MKDLPSAPALRERIALAEDRYHRAVEENEQLRKEVADLKAEISDLRAHLPAKPEGAHGDLDKKTQEVLVYLFEHEIKDCEVRTMAAVFQMSPNVLNYHLDRLQERHLGNASLSLGGPSRWYVTEEGRRYVVENGLAS